MVKQFIPLTAAEIDAAWGNANFGDMPKQDVIKYGLLKVASGYYQGHTSRTILAELKLITPDYKLTERGRRSLYDLFCVKPNEVP